MTIDPRTIAADIMCGNARSITVGEIWAHIGQAYDTTEIDASIADEVADLIAKTGIDLIWPDGSKNTELDAARVEIERLGEQVESFSTLLNQTQDQLAEAREQLFARKPVIEAALAWAEMREMGDVTPTEARKLAGALNDAVEQYRLMDMALTSARQEAEDV